MITNVKYNEDRGFRANKPFNDMRMATAYNLLLENIDRVPVEKLEQFLEELNIR